MTDPVFFKPARRFTVGEVAALCGARLLSPEFADRLIAGLASAETGGQGTLIFVESKKHAQVVAATEAAAVLCPEELAAMMPAEAAVLATEYPHKAFVDIARLLFPAAAWPVAMTGETGVSPAAHVHADAALEEGVVVEAGAVVAAGAQIGRGTVVAPTAVIGADCRIGRDCHIGPGATIQCALIGDRVLVGPGARIGHDGFGYLPGKAGPDKIPQIGRVVIQDDVEIGANTTIDRGAIDDTIIGESTKIDNLVQIAHNVRIGRACILAGNCGLSGSVRLGDGVLLGGGVGIADHVNIGSGVAIAASSGVMNDIPAGARWGGTPAKPLKDAIREYVILRKLVKESADRDKRNG